jgi:hypothetical protein
VRLAWRQTARSQHLLAATAAVARCGAARAASGLQPGWAAARREWSGAGGAGGRAGWGLGRRGCGWALVGTGLGARARAWEAQRRAGWAGGCRWLGSVVLLGAWCLGMWGSLVQSTHRRVWDVSVFCVCCCGQCWGMHELPVSIVTATLQAIHDAASPRLAWGPGGATAPPACRRLALSWEGWAGGLGLCRGGRVGRGGAGCWAPGLSFHPGGMGGRDGTWPWEVWVGGVWDYEREGLWEVWEAAWEGTWCPLSCKRPGWRMGLGGWGV